MLTDSWHRYVTSAWTAGILQYIRDQKKDFALWQYNSWGSWNQDQEYNRGQYSILDLPDLSDFDAAAVDVTNITDPYIRRAVLDKVQASGLPSCSLCYEAKGIFYVGVDGYTAIKKLVSHLFTDRGCRTFHFAGGPAGQFESEIRRRAFLDAMEQFHIPAESFRITGGNFTSDNGRAAASSYTRPGARPLPDAFVCANDNIAVGLIIELERHGIRCPEDVLVTGFDNLDKAAYFQPQITTASLNRESVAYKAAEILDQQMQNQDCGKTIYPLPHENFVDAPIVLSESSGDPNSGAVDYRSYLKWQICDGLTQDSEEQEYSRAAAALANAHSLSEVLAAIISLYRGYDCDGVYIVMDERISRQAENSSYSSCPDFSHGKFDRRHLHLNAFWDCDASLMTELESGMDEREFQELLRSGDSGAHFFCMALHIRDAAVGYVLLKNPRFMAGKWRFFQIQDLVLTFLSRWYSSHQLELSLKELSGIYIRDQLTGVYARTAFRPKLTEIFDGWAREGKKAAVFFVDADHFKEINDSFGHERGDRILVEIAGKIREALPEDGFVMRYGGDEFVASCPVAGEPDAEMIRDHICQDLLREDIGTSIGISLTMGDPLDEGKLEQYIRKADASMYEIKQQHHAK